MKNPLNAGRWKMAIRWLLFETKLGAWLLILLERKAKLAIVSAEWLGQQSAGVPAGMVEAE